MTFYTVTRGFSSDEVIEQVAPCENGDTATGGGYNVFGIPMFVPFTNRPHIVAGKSVGWSVFLDFGFGSPVANYQVFAVCADTTP